MSTISKTSVPSLFDSCTNILLAAAVLRQHAGFRKQEKYSTPLDSWSRVISSINKGGRLELCALRKRGQNLVSKAFPCSSQLECFDYRKEHDFSNCIVTNVLISIILYKYLQELHADAAYIRAIVLLKNVLEVFLKSWKLMISVHFFRQILSEMKCFTKYLEYFHQVPEMLVVLVAFCLQMPIKKKTFAKELRYFHNSPKILTSLRTFCSELKRFSESLSIILEFQETRKIFQLTSQQMPSTTLSSGDNSKNFLTIPEISVSTTTSDKLTSLKCSEKCYLCQEMISEKKFFDERRFGILNNCDCMFCYGCLRKTSNTSGVVRGPVRCPSCSIESSSVAASASWIEGEKKFMYFNLMQDYEVLENNLGWTNSFQCGVIKESVWSTSYSVKFDLQRFEAYSTDMQGSEAFCAETETLQEYWNFHRTVGYEKSEFSLASPYSLKHPISEFRMFPAPFISERRIPTSIGKQWVW